MRQLTVAQARLQLTELTQVGYCQLYSINFTTVNSTQMTPLVIVISVKLFNVNCSDTVNIWLRDAGKVLTQTSLDLRDFFTD